jgi:RHS repeat-associated protein
VPPARTEGAGGIGGLIAITEITGARTNVYLPICDLNGNIHRVLDGSTGATVAEYAYSPYGALIEESYASASARHTFESGSFLFSSKYFDHETGLCYYGHRYYDPTSCKWACRDPLGEAGGPNIFVFCGNDPVNNFDPLGLFDLPTHANVTVSAMRELKGKLGLTDSQFGDLIRGAVEGAMFPDMQTRVPIPVGQPLPFIQDARRFDQFIDYPTDQAKKGLKYVSGKIGDLNAAAIGLVWSDYPRIRSGLMNWWEHGPSLLGPAFSWGSQYNTKVESLYKTHFGELSWQHGMGDKTMTAADLQSKMIAGSLENMGSYTECVGKGNYYDAGFALGKTLHYLQDTYTPSHAERDIKTGQITAFFDYNPQSPALHATEDKSAFGGPVYNTAVQQSQTLILMFLNGKTADIPSFFQLAPRVQIGEPGPFVTDKEIIPPVKLLQDNWR